MSSDLGFERLRADQGLPHEEIKGWIEKKRKGGMIRLFRWKMGGLLAKIGLGGRGIWVGVVFVSIGVYYLRYVHWL